MKKIESGSRVFMGKKGWVSDILASTTMTFETT